MTTREPAVAASGITIRELGADEIGDALAIINAAASIYRGVIPADRWRDPYMPADELASEVRDGVSFSGAVAGGCLIGVMGVQRRHNVDLIRHAYVDPGWQGRGIGAALLDHLRTQTDLPILIGTWRTAVWAIRFYERHGFAAVQDRDIAPLLRCYWTVPDRQIATSVVLADPPLVGCAAEQLIARAR